MKVGLSGAASGGVQWITRTSATQLSPYGSYYKCDECKHIEAEKYDILHGLAEEGGMIHFDHWHPQPQKAIWRWDSLGPGSVAPSGLGTTSGKSGLLPGQPFHAKQKAFPSAPPPCGSGAHDDTLLVGKLHPNSLRRGIRAAVVIAQCFSVMPVSGAFGPHPRFRWRFRAAYTMFVIGWFALSLCLSFSDVFKRSGTFRDYWGKLYFFSHTCVASMLYMRLATRWHQLVTSFERVESSMARQGYGYPERLDRHLRLVTATILTSAAVEHAAFYWFAIQALSDSKTTEESKTFDDGMRQFYQIYQKHILVIPYSPFLLILARILDAIGTFIWNYNDLFISLVSIAISERYRIFNKRLVTDLRQDLAEEYWETARLTYFELSQLAKEADSLLSAMVLLSFGSNLVSICMYLLSALKADLGVFFIISLIHLLVRTGTVSFTAAAVSGSSRALRDVLYSIPSRTYSVHVERLLIQVVTDDIAISGLGFFKVTRSLILTMAGTIVTYEIILMQFPQTLTK